MNSKLHRRYLLFSSVGDQSKHKDFWLHDHQSRNFDAYLCYFGDHKDRYREDADFYFECRGSKWQNLHRALIQDENIFKRYTHIFVPDDDIEIDTKEISKLFEIAEQTQLQLCQPAYSQNSFSFWQLTFSRINSLLRYSNFVECSVPLFSADAFWKCRNSFALGITGNGLDFAWPQILGFPENGIAIIDSVQCRHRWRKSENDKLLSPSERYLHGLNVLAELNLPRFIPTWHRQIKDQSGSVAPKTENAPTIDIKTAPRFQPRTRPVCFYRNCPDSPSETFLAAQYKLYENRVVYRAKGPVSQNETAPRLRYIYLVRILAQLFRIKSPWLNQLPHLLTIGMKRPSSMVVNFIPVAFEALPLVRRLKIPLIVYVHGYDAYQNQIYYKNWQLIMEVFEAASAIIVVSEDMHERVRALGVAESKIKLLPCAVDTRRFCPNRDKLPQSYLIAVGRFVEKKSPVLLVQAFARAVQVDPTIKLRWVGDGPLLGSAIDLARSLNIADKIVFLGSQNSDVVLQLMLDARAFIQHSIIANDGDAEGTPVAALEASACGLPVIATRHKGILQAVLDGQTGLLCDEFDVEKMASQMLTIWQDSELACRLGKQAREHVIRNYSHEDWSQRFTDIINECENFASQNL